MTVKRHGGYSNNPERVVAKEYSFGLSELGSEVGKCLYKLYCGDRYIIHKGKSLSGSLFLLQKGCGYFLAFGHKVTDDINHYYFRFYQYVKNHRDKPFSVELIMESGSGYELLMKEQQELDSARKKAKCLNNNITSYIPIQRSDGNHGWISKEEVERFTEYLNNR